MVRLRYTFRAMEESMVQTNYWMNTNLQLKNYYPYYKNMMLVRIVKLRTTADNWRSAYRNVNLKHKT